MAIGPPRLRKARSQRESVPGRMQRIRSFSEGEGEVRRGLGPRSEITRPPSFVLVYVVEECFSPRRSRLRGGIKVFTCGRKVYVGTLILRGENDPPT